jgi:branched-chain amino acid transport system permease protein
MKVKNPLLIIAVACLFVVPIFAGNYVLNLMILAFTFAILASSWDITIGHTGIFNFGHIAFFGVGAYTSAILSKFLGVSPWLAIVAAGAMACLLGLAMGLPSLRLAGIYTCLLTYGFQQLLYLFIIMPGLGGTQAANMASITGGSFGMVDVPTFQLGGIDFSASVSKVPYYYLALVLFCISTFFLYKIIKSPMGVAFVSIRDSEEYAVSRGIDPFKYKLLAFVASAFFAGVIGGFYCHYLESVDPGVISWTMVWFSLAILVVGGLGTFYGPIVAAFVLTFASEYLRGIDLYRYIVLSLIMFFVIIFYPAGLAEVVRSARAHLPKFLR